LLDDSDMLNVLVVDDDEIVRNSISTALESAGHHVSEARDGVEALALAAAHVFDVAICDVQMPRLDGRTLLRRLRQEAPSTSVIIMTSFGRIPDAVGALRDGALDYVTKPFDPEHFAETVIGPIAERRALRHMFDAARTDYLDRATGTHMVAESQVMRTLLDRVGTMAQSDASILIAGESGTGKKLVARRLHEQGPRKDGPFRVVPCASLPSILLESERLELGEGVGSRRHPWLRSVEGGTLVLDGVEELPLDAQGALVRVLESAPAARRRRDWQPLGVRLVSLTRAKLSEWLPVRFLPTLYFRLSAVTLDVPPLRERPADLVPLARQAIEERTPPGRSTPTMEPGAWAALSAYAFPGNVSELERILEEAMTLAGSGPIDARHLPASTAGSRGVVAHVGRRMDEEG
jgi:DNA-binding NtrC family response regulator